MQTRSRRGRKVSSPVEEDARPARRSPALSLRWLSLLLLVALTLVAVLAPAGQAHSGGELSPEAEAALATQKATEREERAAVKQAQRAAERSARPKVERVPSERLQKARSDERTNAVVEISCTQIAWNFREFPEAPGNTVTEKIKIDQVSSSTTFTFDGSTGSNVTPIHAPPGTYIIDVSAKWRKASANGASGSFDIHSKVTCVAEPSFTIEKLQRIEGNVAPYTTAPQKAEVGETVDYEILLANTGNVPLSLSSFTDPRCDEGTISGGPAEGTLAVGESSAYLCKHLLTEADLAVGSYANTVSILATPPSGDGSPVTQVSNTVVTEVDPRSALPANKEEKEKTQPSSSTSPVAAGGVSPTSATAAPASGQTPKSGVLAFSSGTVPSLKGPQGCVRSSFHASVKSAGVASVTFYLDGHKLRRLTAHSAHGGLLTITISAAKLKLGAHRLLAKITMKPASSTAKAVQGSRSITVLRCHSDVVTPKFTG
jgi:hypothetical protein